MNEKEMELMIRKDQQELALYAKQCQKVYGLCVEVWQRGGEQRKKVVEIMTSWWMNHVDSMNEMKEELKKHES